MVDSFGRSKGDNGSLKVKHFKWFKLLFLNHIKISFSLSNSLNSGKLVRGDTNQGMSLKVKHFKWFKFFLKSYKNIFFIEQ
jgi:hypothetical protein